MHFKKLNSMKLFNTETGTLVVDDELVASRAGDVESKVLSDKKAGKEGTMADCLADSTICLLLGIVHIIHHVAYLLC